MQNRFVGRDLMHIAGPKARRVGGKFLGDDDIVGEMDGAVRPVRRVEDFQRRVLQIMLAERLAYIDRSEEHTSELQSLMRSSYAVFCLKKKTITTVSALSSSIS